MLPRERKFGVLSMPCWKFGGGGWGVKSLNNETGWISLHLFCHGHVFFVSRLC